PAVFNAANEVAVAAFLAGKVPFLAISRIVEHTLSRLKTVEPNSLAEVISLDHQARMIATAHLPQVS
ncbi:MAG TPA: 1-deoxy-D-xylulose-5-phosphate reductoisomerase, partial [Lacunisphaera sp.]